MTLLVLLIHAHGRLIDNAKNEAVMTINLRANDLTNVVVIGKCTIHEAPFRAFQAVGERTPPICDSKISRSSGFRFLWNER